MATSTAAMDWQIVTGIAETLRYSDNIDLDVDPEHYTILSTPAADIDLTGRTHTFLFNTNAAIAYQHYLVEGSDDQENAFNSQRRHAARKATQEFDLLSHIFDSHRRR